MPSVPTEAIDALGIKLARFPYSLDTTVIETIIAEMNERRDWDVLRRTFDVDAFQSIEEPLDGEIVVAKPSDFFGLPLNQLNHSLAKNNMMTFQQAVHDIFRSSARLMEGGPAEINSIYVRQKPGENPFLVIRIALKDLFKEYNGKNYNFTLPPIRCKVFFWKHCGRVYPMVFVSKQSMNHWRTTLGVDFGYDDLVN